MYVRFHRGLSHSSSGSPFPPWWSPPVRPVRSWKDRKRLFLLTLLGQLSHVALDLLNAYGTQVLQPFSDARFSLDLLSSWTGSSPASSWRDRPVAGRPRGPGAGRAGAPRGVRRGGSGAPRPAVDGVRDARRASRRPGGLGARPAAPPHGGAPRPGPRGFATPAVASMSAARGQDGGTSVPFPAGPLAWDASSTTGGRTSGEDRAAPRGAGVAERVVRGPDVPEVRSFAGMSEVETYLVVRPVSRREGHRRPPAARR